MRQALRVLLARSARARSLFPTSHLARPRSLAPCRRGLRSAPTLVIVVLLH